MLICPSGKTLGNFTAPAVASGTLRKLFLTSGTSVRGRQADIVQDRTEVGNDPGCVKTCTRGERTELCSLFSSFGGAGRSSSFLIQRIETNFLRESLTSEFSHSLKPIRDVGNLLRCRPVFDLDQRKLPNRSSTAARQIVSAGEAATVRENGHHPRTYGTIRNRER